MFQVLEYVTIAANLWRQWDSHEADLRLCASYRHSQKEMYVTLLMCLNFAHDQSHGVGCDVLSILKVRFPGEGCSTSIATRHHFLRFPLQDFQGCFSSMPHRNGGKAIWAEPADVKELMTLLGRSHGKGRFSQLWKTKQRYRTDTGEPLVPEAHQQPQSYLNGCQSLFVIIKKQAFQSE